MSSDIRFLGVEREPVFSPGKVAADAAILHAVGRILADGGHDVRIVDAGSMSDVEPDEATVVFAMCQGDAPVARLTAWEARAVRVINRPTAILASQRFRAIPRLARAGVSLPPTRIMPASAELSADLGGLADAPFWVKRGDVHATEPEDVVFVAERRHLGEILERFRSRGIERVAIQRHVPGVVFKFYGVAGGFFHCVAPAGAGLPDESGAAAMAALGERAAAALDLEVYGGDCVQDVRGVFHLIDLNDWPSYGPCRAQGAAAIAAYILAQKDITCS